jgi:hypothetical protein
MAIEFNLLSGAKIDTELRLLYEILISGQSFLGFSRNLETWGQGALIKYTAIKGQTWPNGVVGDATDAKIYDEYHRLLNISSGWESTIHIAKYNENITGDPIPLTAASAGIVEWVSADLIETIFINEDWILARGLDPTYSFDPVDNDGTTTFKYFIFNSDKNPANMLQIDYLNEFEYPGLSTKVQFKYAPVDSTTPYDAGTADVVPGGDDLERRLNIQGEYLVTGISQDFIDWFETDPNAKNATFFLVDTAGALLLDKIIYEEAVVTAEETAYIFSYVVQDTTPSGGTVTRKVRFKLSTKVNINNRMAVFHESLPVRSLIAPVADNNPPGLQVSYVRHPSIHESIFDVVGAQQLAQDDVWMVYEIPADSTETLQYFQALDSTYADPNILTIETIDIDQNAATSTTVQKTYAKTKDIGFSARENFNSIMVDVSLDSATPTEEIYRQIFISWGLKYYDGTAGFVMGGTGIDPGPSYSGRSKFFNPNTHSNDVGVVFYVANKFPVYRKYLTTDETIKIIL